MFFFQCCHLSANLDSYHLSFHPFHSCSILSENIQKVNLTIDREFKEMIYSPIQICNVLSVTFLQYSYLCLEFLKDSIFIFFHFHFICWDVQWGACGWCLKIKLGAHLHCFYLFRSGALSLNLKSLLVIKWELKKSLWDFSCCSLDVSSTLRVHFNCYTDVRSRMSWDASCFDWRVQSWFQISLLFCFCCCTSLFTAFRSVMIIKRLYSWKLIKSLISLLD